MFASPHYSPIGIDLGGRGIRAVQLRRSRSGGEWSLAASAVLARGHAGEGLSGEQASSAMGALARQGFRGERVVVAMPAKQLLTAVLDVPPRSSGAPLDLICRNELARTHRVEPDSIESAWWELPVSSMSAREADGMQAMAVGCREADAESLIAVFDAAGAQTSAIDTRGSALARAVARRVPSSPALSAVIEWDWDSAMIVVLRGDTIVYERPLGEAGLIAAQREVAAKLGIDPDVAAYMLESIALGEAPADMQDEADLVEASRRIIGEWVDSIAGEARASFAYAARRFGEAVSAVFACGEGSQLAGVAPRLGGRLESTVAVATASTLLPGSPEPLTPARSASLAVAIGLAAYPPEALA